MRLSRSSLRDLALASLGLVVLALVLAVLGGTGSPGTATPAPAAAATPSSPPPPPAVRALLLGDARAAELAPAVASATGWDVSAEASPATGLVTGPAGAELSARAAASAASAAAADVVVLVASASDGEQPDPASYGARVRALIAAVRIARPEVQVVVLGPVGTTPDAFRMQRDALTLASARFGTFFVDPVSGGWLDGRPELLAPDGTTPSAAGTAEIARRMVADLQVVLPPGLLPPA